MQSIQWCAFTLKPARKVLFVNAFATHFVNYHTQERVRYGQDCQPGRW